MTCSKEYIERAENAVLHTYNRFPVVFDHGEGVYLYDLEGKKYLDFGAGIAVFSLGYGNQEYNEALKNLVQHAEKDAVANGLLDNARSNAETILRSFFGNVYNLEEYEIRFINK